MRIERRYTKAGQSPYATIAFRTRDERDPQPGRLGRVQARRHRGAGSLEPGRLRRAGPEILPQGRRAGAPEEASRRTTSPRSCGAPSPTRRRSPRCPRTSASAPRSRSQQVFDRLAGCWTYWGWKGGYFSDRGGCARPSSTSCASCSRARWWRRTRRNGSTPACTGPTASTGRARAISTSTHKTGRLTKSKIGLRASAAACLLHPVRRRTTSSTRAASWTCGCARRACSSTAPAPARTSRACAARARSCPAAGARPA